MLYFLFMHTQSYEIWFLIEWKLLFVHQKEREKEEKEGKKKVNKKSFSIKWFGLVSACNPNTSGAKSFDGTLNFHSTFLEY